MNPCELEIAIFCRGLRIDPSCDLEHDGRPIRRTRAGLGSGIEIVIEGKGRPIWTNAPIEEGFAARSPFVLRRRAGAGGYEVADESDGASYPVRLPAAPAWYGRRTSRGTLMSEVGVLQGTYLGIYIGKPCGFWKMDPPQQCAFCTTGLNVGEQEVLEKDVDDVVEVASAARRESGVTFVHFNSGYQDGREPDIAIPYVKAVKERVGALVGVQMIPARDLKVYDDLIRVGVDHFSFCFEFGSQECFDRYLPGKSRHLGLEIFLRAMDYTARKMGKGRVSGEIVAGIEPIEETLRAIDRIASAGAFPTVCVFRPLSGSGLQDLSPPRYEDMLRVFRRVYLACRENGIPIGLAPNIEVSLVPQPTDTFYLAPPGIASRWYAFRCAALARLLKPYFQRKMQPRSR